MAQLVRLTYASTATARPDNLRQDLTDILEQARIYNMNKNIHGVLYYGNDYFFQSIEGRKAQIDSLYQQIERDPRHKNVMLLSYEHIQHGYFSEWAMKYVRQDQHVQQFFEQMHWEKFNPYALKDDLIEPFMQMLLSHPYVITTQLQYDKVPRHLNLVLNLLSVVLVVGFLALLVLYMLYTTPIMS